MAEKVTDIFPTPHTTNYGEIHTHLYLDFTFDPYRSLKLQASQRIFLEALY